MTDLRKGALVALAIPLVLLAGAFTSQWLGLVACEMCWWQRWAHVYALAPAATANLFQTMWMRRSGETAGRADNATRIWTLVSASLILSSGLIGAYQAGIEYHWWEGHTACTAMSHARTLQDMAREFDRTSVVRCDEAQWTLMGISLAGYNAILSTLAAIAAAALVLRRR